MQKLHQLKGNERAEKIQHLKDLFRLDFRVHLRHDIEMIADLNDPDCYDNEIDFELGGTPAGFNGADQQLMEEYHQDFLALDAESEFNELCIDYYRDVVDESNYRADMMIKQLEQFESDDPEKLAKMNGKSRARYEARYDALLDKIEMNQKYYEIAMAKLRALMGTEKGVNEPIIEKD